jgi:hypothetical protein
MRGYPRLAGLLLATTALLCAARLVEVAGTAWPGNLEVFPAVDGRFPPVPPSVVGDSDGEGGAILVFADGGQVRAQRISPDGEVLWGADGVPIPSSVDPPWALRAVADGSGGALVAWLECAPDQTTGCDVFAQRLDGGGGLLWEAAGVQVSDAATLGFDVAADGSGGAYVAWSERVTCVQRIDASGAPLWEAGALPCTSLLSADPTAGPRLLPDGAGGVFLAWQSHPQTSAWGAQRLGPTGAFLWSETFAAGAGEDVQLVADASGGVFILRDLVAHRVDADGGPLWTQPIGGTPPFGRSVVADGAGGVIAVWSEGTPRSAQCSPPCALRAQRLDPDGERLWGPFAATVADGADAPRLASLVSDGAEGAIVLWRNCVGLICDDDVELFAQRVDATGARRWFGAGVAVSTEPLFPGHPTFAPPRVIPDDAGGALVAWRDLCGITDRCSLFSQRVVVTGEQLLAACEDGFEDDGDGLVDHPADPGCDAPADDSERSPALPCDDGFDQDGDELVDFPSDPGCASPMDDTETQAGAVCDDGLDNDGDGNVDLADEGCDGISDPNERLLTDCDDGFDGDRDGRIDFPDDPGCAAPADDSERSNCAPGDFLCDRRFLLDGAHRLKAKGRGDTSGPAAVDLVFGDGNWVATVGDSGSMLAGDYQILSAKKGKAQLRVHALAAQILIDTLLGDIGAPAGSLLPPEDAAFRLRVKPERPVRMDARWKLEPAGDGRRGSYRLKAEGEEFQPGPGF